MPYLRVTGVFIRRVIKGGDQSGEITIFQREVVF